MHELLSYFREMQMDPEASPIDHVALVKDPVDIDNAGLQTYRRREQTTVW